jgi:hypothetical protein
VLGRTSPSLIICVAIGISFLATRAAWSNLNSGKLANCDTVTETHCTVVSDPDSAMAQ